MLDTILNIAGHGGAWIIIVVAVVILYNAVQADPKGKFTKNENRGGAIICTGLFIWAIVWIASHYG